MNQLAEPIPTVLPDLAERVEFLSREWIETASRFLTDQVAARPELADVQFSWMESFDDAPPALDWPDNRACWHCRISRGVVHAAAGPLPEADLHISAPYVVGLAHAQCLYAAGAAAMARAGHEIAQRFGSAAMQVSGAMPGDPQVRALLQALHDFLGLRTIDNPHFDHRVRSLGLSAAVEQLATDGYAIVERAVTAETADALCARTAEEVTRHHPLTSNGLMMRDRLFEEVALNPLVCTLAQSAVGQHMILGAMSGTYKKTGPGAIPAHADYPLVRAPYPEYGLIAVAVWALQDWDSTAVGPTWVMPGSHRQQRPPGKGDDLSGAVPILMPKGSALLISHGIWHWQGDRSAAGARVAIHVTYNRVFVRQLDNFSAVGEAHYARNPPAFATLMGQDDPFGKSSFTGHDNRRFAYAGRFTQT